MAETWRAIVASSLDWEQAHASLESAIADFPSELRGRRPSGYPHSAWELVEHIRLAQEDLADFMESPSYAARKWPEGYWPSSPAPPTAAAWDESVAAIERDRKRLQSLATRADLDLTARIPNGSGQTYLRTILVALDHAAYHIGQIVAVRRLLGAWSAS